MGRQADPYTHGLILLTTVLLIMAVGTHASVPGSLHQIRLNN